MNDTDTMDIEGPAPGRIAQAFARALELARAYEGATAPNPPVGCVLLDAAGIELAYGAHRRAGTPHAEAMAIAAARQSGVVGKIHTAVVTLEPCTHHGRTPPCAEALLATPARHIWIACRDPNPKVGSGVERLIAEGRRVRMLADLPHPDASTLADDAERLIAPFCKHALTGLPFITVKQALSNAGSMIPPPGRKTFTAHSSLVLAHSLRRRADAILTGSGTALADDPHFTVRLVADHPDKQRLLVILDRRRRVSPDYLAAARRRGFVVHLEDDLHAALAMIGASGAMEVLVEGGPSLTRSVLETALWDELVLIEQAGDPGGTDRVTIRRRQAAELHPHTKE